MDSSVPLALFAPSGLRLGAQIFLPGGNTAPDVPLRFVLFQHLLDLKVEASVVEGQTLLYILMYGYH